MHRFLAPATVFLAVQCLLTAEVTPVTEKTYHLGTKGVPEWKEFAARSPHGRNLSLLFQSQKNAEETTLFLRQDDVKQGWKVSLNGKRLGNLQRFESKMLHSLKVSPGSLKDGENRLSVAAPATAIDDIFVGDAFLIDSPLSVALSRSFLDIHVTDLKDGTALPCRITITDADDYLMPLEMESSPRLAIRTGVIYSLNGRAKPGVLPGEYVVYASRGFEYGVASAKISIKEGETKSVKLSIGREVPTEGWISCDPHIHVRTFSGHGDSTVEERIPTIAGEGLELPIATDHNHHADYRPYQRAAGATSFFTPVIGNEVTTKVGHFNAFPIRKGAPLPNHKTESWPELFRSMRSTPGVEIILLNHPRNVHSNFSPTDPAHFHRVTGESKREGPLTMDAIEVITSAALQADYMGPFQDWFALLNSGHRLTAAGSSDTHDVNRYILGQGRTYLRCPDGEPGKIDVGAACRAFREGRALVSMGLLAKLKVAGRFEVGDLATRLPAKVPVEIEVLGPSWVDADRIVLYANGLPIWESKIESPQDKPLKALQKTELPEFSHDFHLVAIATGPGVTKPFWEIPRPYQHKSREYLPKVVGATNPVWIDADGDKQYTSPKAYAEKIVGGKSKPLKTILKELEDYDESICAQAAALLVSRKVDLADSKAKAVLGNAAPKVRRGIDAYLRGQP